VDKDDLAKKRFELELQLANQPQMTSDEKTKVLMRLLDWVEKELFVDD
tara:strand:+ start:833 stop:976 length:144 start_codon:yes stop_codon:yes gene_type:complete